MTSCLANSNNIGSSKNLEILTSSDRPWNVCVCVGGGVHARVCVCGCVCMSGCACTCVCVWVGDYSPSGIGSLH